RGAGMETKFSGPVVPVSRIVLSTVPPLIVAVRTIVRAASCAASSAGRIFTQYQPAAAIPATTRRRISRPTLNGFFGSLNGTAWGDLAGCSGNWFGAETLGCMGRAARAQFCQLRMLRRYCILRGYPRLRNFRPYPFMEARNSALLRVLLSLSNRSSIDS